MRKLLAICCAVGGLLLVGGCQTLAVVVGTELVPPVMGFAQQFVPSGVTQVEKPDNLRANIENLKRTNACPKCYLQGANLRGANLWRSDLWRANLREADLQGANLQGANLNYALLQGAILRGAKLDGDDLAMAKAQGGIGLDEAGAEPQVENKPTKQSAILSFQDAKRECAEIGFKKGTEKYGECVLKLHK